MGFDDVFTYIGGAGAYQTCLYLLLGLPSFFGGYQSMSMTFLGPEQDHWCQIERLQNFSHAQQKYIAIPYNEESGEYEQCWYYNLPFDDYTDEELWNWNRTDIENSENVTQKKCNTWVYDQSEYLRTAISEYNLVCDDKYRVQLVYSSYMAATVVAGIVAGPLSDRFGRATVLTIASFFQGFLGIAASFAPGYISFILLRFFMSVSITFASTCCFVLSMEVFGTQYRAIAGGLYWLFWAVGFSILPGISYFIRDFQKLQIALAAPMLSTWCYVIIVLESPRWMVTNNHWKKSEEILEFIADVNGKDVAAIMTDVKNNIHIGVITKEMDHNTEKDTTSTSDLSLLDIIRIPVLRKHFFSINPGWISCTLIYYGMSFNTGSLAGSVYWNTFFSGLVEIPAYLLSLPFMYKLGRKYTQLGSLLFSGVACFVCIPFLGNESLGWLTTTLMMIGKAAITLSFSVIFVYTAELFPTPVRHQAVGINYMFGNLLSLVAPFMGSGLMEIWEPLPLVIFGTLGTISGLLIFLLPETLDRKLPDTVKEVEDLKNAQKQVISVYSIDGKHQEKNTESGENFQNTYL